MTDDLILKYATACRALDSQRCTLRSPACMNLQRDATVSEASIFWGILRPQKLRVEYGVSAGSILFSYG